MQRASTTMRMTRRAERRRTTGATAAVIVALTGLMASGAAEARFKITAPRPARTDFARALRASRAVDRQLPLRLTATTRPRAVTRVQGDVIHERATVIANVDYDTFIRRLDPTGWSKNLPQRWGGEVTRVGGHRGAGGTRTALQQERMVVGLPALDMTKNTVVRVGKDRARILWQVTHSDRTPLTLNRETVRKDDGWIEFARTPDNRVQITSRSAHAISTAPSDWLGKLAPKTAERLTAASLASYFRQTVGRYKAIGEGRRIAR